MDALEGNGRVSQKRGNKMICPNCKIKMMYVPSELVLAGLQEHIGIVVDVRQK